MNTTSEPLQVAIDGPVGAGKSDVSKRLAARLGVLYLYTGAMYRALAYACLSGNIPLSDEAAVVSVLDGLEITLEKPPEGSPYPVLTRIGSEDVTPYLFEVEVDRAVPDVSKIAQVRKRMVERQQEMAKGKSVVMEGRDIGIRVLPHAQLKIYLTASIEERAARRYAMMGAKRAGLTINEVIEDTEKRDIIDTTRTADPLRKLPDAWELDTTGMTQEQVVDRIVEELKKRNLV